MTRAATLALAAMLLGCHQGRHGSPDAATSGGDAAGVSDASATLDGGEDASALPPLPDLRWKWVGAFPSYATTCASC